MRIDRVKFAAELVKRDLTQKAFAERAGVSRQTIGYIRAGKSCSEEVGRKIADALDIPIEKLLEK